MALISGFSQQVFRPFTDSGVPLQSAELPKSTSAVTDDVVLSGQCYRREMSQHALEKFLGVDKEYDTGAEYILSQGGKALYTVRTSSHSDSLDIYEGDQVDNGHLIDSIDGRDFKQMLESAKRGDEPAFPPHARPVYHAYANAQGDLTMRFTNPDTDAIMILDLSKDAFSDHGAIKLSAGPLDHNDSMKTTAKANLYI